MTSFSSCSSFVTTNYTSIFLKKIWKKRINEEKTYARRRRIGHVTMKLCSLKSRFPYNKHTIQSNLSFLFRFGIGVVRKLD